ncbi:cysteine peptidase family C39 domain-containing protein, partial [Lacticaseibacillus paracasei]
MELKITLSSIKRLYVQQVDEKDCGLACLDMILK